MENNIKYDWNDKLKMASCHIKYNDNVFTGRALCHDDDKIFASEKVGCEIAYKRAIIKSLQYRKNVELKPALKALKQLQSSIERSKKYDKKHYEARMLIRLIKQYEADIELTKDLIDNVKEDLYTYIDNKEKFYQKIKKSRG